MGKRHQAGIGDWLTLSDRCDDMGELAKRMSDTGRRAGIWMAPFLVGERSRLARIHPEWLLDKWGTSTLERLCSERPGPEPLTDPPW